MDRETRLIVALADAGARRGDVKIARPRNRARDGSIYAPIACCGSRIARECCPRARRPPGVRRAERPQAKRERNGYRFESVRLAYAHENRSRHSLEPQRRGKRKKENQYGRLRITKEIEQLIFVCGVIVLRKWPRHGINAFTLRRRRPGETKGSSAEERTKGCGKAKSTVASGHFPTATTNAI